VRAVIRVSHCLTVREDSEEVGTCKSSYTVFTEKSDMYRVPAEFVPRRDRGAKTNRVTVSQELFDRSNAVEHFL
jgi:hypothetical protein